MESLKGFSFKRLEDRDMNNIIYSAGRGKVKFICHCPNALNHPEWLINFGRKFVSFVPNDCEMTIGI